MPIINRAVDLVGEITLWQRDLHENAELDPSRIFYTSQPFRPVVSKR